MAFLLWPVFRIMVPDGLDQMGIIAASVHADVAIVGAFQLFQILFLSVLIVLLVKFVAVGSEQQKRVSAENARKTKGSLGQEVQGCLSCRLILLFLYR